MLKNSLLYIQRKKKKSIIILCIQTTILFSLYICLVINQFSQQVEGMIYRAANSSFILKSKNGQDLIDLKVVKDIPQLDKIDRYNLEYETTAHLKDADVFGVEQRVELSNLDSEYKNLLKVYGVRSSHLTNDFTSEVFKIAKGRHIKKDDNNKIIIHEALAKQNHYKIGDTISIKQLTVDSQPAKNGSPKTSIENKYEIVGIFSGKKQESYTGFSSDYSENMAFIDYNSSQKIAGIAPNNEKIKQATYFVNSPESMDKVISKVKKLGIDWSNVEIEKNTKNFDSLSSTINSIKKIIQIITYSIIVGGCIVLSLILILWLRERIYEIGVLVSIGVGKKDIIGQFILELVFLSIPSFVIAMVIGHIAIGKIVSEMIVNGKLIGMLDKATMTSGNVLVAAQSYGLMIFIIVLSVFVTSGIFLLKKPKEILSKMS